ncbi:MAG: dihydrolipoamide acetyltransferase family protein, partial [Proteobacteria bacterium]|nr:dihydrolipoamide acetyltransferase family protein [Pseudomonadota bacterium]
VYMAIEVTMPKLGLTMETGKITEWKKAEGAQVNQGEILLVVETEKITYEVECPANGLLHIIVPQDGEVPVAELIAIIAADKAEYDKVAAGGAPAAAAPARADGERVKASPLARKLAGEAGIDIAAIGGTGPEGRVVKKDVLSWQETNKFRITPVAGKMAKENNIDLKQVAGTGPGGKITREDIEAYLAQQKAPAAAAAPAEKKTGEAKMGEGDKIVKLTSMRKVISRKMLESTNQAAQAYMTNSIDATLIQAFREKILAMGEKKHGVRVTITDFVMKITAMAIERHPVINTRWTGEGILFVKDINIGMAMSIKDGLVVPVIKNANKKSIIEIAKDRTALIDKGRNGKLGPAEMTGGTFTVSAMGMFGTELFTAIINQPENAILGVGAIIDKPVVVNKQIVIKPMMNLSLTYDHRTIDGADAGRFLQTLKELHDDPMLILAE